MWIFKSFCENNGEKARILQEYTEKGSLFGEPSFLSLLSFDFYLCCFQFSSYTFKKCSSSFSLGISAVSW